MKNIRKGMNHMAEKMNLKFEYGVLHSLQETADMFGISRERVRQMEKRALDKIKKVLEVKYGITSLEDML